MFGAHLPELAIVMVLALVVFGPKRLPEIGSSLGRGIRDFKKGISHLEGGDEAPAPGAAPQPIAVTRDHEVA